MKIIFAHCENGYVGCNVEDVFLFDDEMTEAEIDQEIWYWACENAESFAYVHFGWDEPYTEEDYDDYIENHVNFDWYEATHEEYVKWCERGDF